MRRAYDRPRRNVVGYEDEEIVIGPIPFSSRARQNLPPRLHEGLADKYRDAQKLYQKAADRAFARGDLERFKKLDAMVSENIHKAAIHEMSAKDDEQHALLYTATDLANQQWTVPRQNPIHGARRNPGATLASSSSRRPPALNPPLLPLTSSRRKWDATKARRALKKWATTKSGQVDMKKYARGFLAHDGNPQNLTSYKLPIATVIKDKAGRSRLKAVPHAIYAAAGVIDGARGGVELPAGQRTKAKAQLARYYKKMKKTPPWRK